MTKDEEERLARLREAVRELPAYARSEIQFLLSLLDKTQEALDYWKETALTVEENVAFDDKGEA